MAKLPRPFDYWTTYPNHGGIDYPEPMHAPIRASAAGLITFSGWYSERGGYAKFVDYGDGIEHGYYHLVNLNGGGVGKQLQYGDTFAYVGSTGHSTGPHLHHEVWRNGKLLKPPAYWDHVDASRCVADGSTAGGGGLPFPTPTPPEEEEVEEMAKTTGITFPRNGETVCALINPVSGFWSEWSGADGDYNNPIAAGFDTGTFVPVTEGHAGNLYASAKQVRERQ